MSIIRQLMQGLTATGRHRAVDRVPVLEARLAATQAKLTWADKLITKVCQEKNALKFTEARLTAEVERLAEANALLADENDELGARLIEARQELANRDAISSPAPADHGKPVPLPKDTSGKTVSSLWTTGGLRTVA